MKNNQLQPVEDLKEIVQKSGLPANKMEILASSFNTFFAQAKELVQDGEMITVKDEKDITGMQQARQIRLQLQKIRTSAEKVRVELKEDSRREGLAIDGINNFLKNLIIPTEKRLFEQEKYAENLKIELDNKLFQIRCDRLAAYNVETSLYNLHPDFMNDETFEKLEQSVKRAWELENEAKARVEQERKHQEHQLQVFNERQIKLLPFSRFIDMTKLKLDTTNSEFNELLKSGEDAQKAHDVEQERLKKQVEADRKAREIAQQKLAKERAEQQKKIAQANKAKLEAENKLKREKELQEQKALEEKRELENQKRLQEEAERKAILAPDKEKLMNLVGLLQEVKTPAVASKQANDVLADFENRMRILQDWLYEEAKKL